MTQHPSLIANPRLLPLSLALLLVPLAIVYLAPEVLCQSFGPQQTITTAASGAMSVFAVDLDSDGDVDVLSASTLDDKIAWYENLGAGNFGPQQVITTSASGAFSVFAIDLDGDSDADVLSASRLDNKIAWYENLGAGLFGSQRVITTATDMPMAVYAVDIDGDGDADVLSASELDFKVAWYENLGAGVFGPQQVITTLADEASSIFAEDIDGDGDTDVLSASYVDNKIAWYENVGGAGVFGPQQVISTMTAAPFSVFAIDLDSDGDPDVLSASIADDKIAWYENQGGGVFGAQQLISSTSDGAVSVFAVDLDGDGDAEVLSASRFDDKIAWYENLGGGLFGPQQVISTAPNMPLSVFAVDLDGDGDSDVLSASSLDNKVAWYENLLGPFDCNGNGIPDHDDIASGISADCDGNGQPDECAIAADASLDLNINGVLDTCECITVNYCVATPNSNGTQAFISGLGSASLSTNSFALRVESAMPNKFGIFFYSSSQQQVPFGEGVLCEGPPVQRLSPVLLTDNSGRGALALDFTMPPLNGGPLTIMPFGTWNFQFWYRDPMGGPAGFNLSNGLQVTFCP